MTVRRSRAVGLPLVAALAALLLSACGAGGFGSKEPTTLNTAIASYVAIGDGFTAAPYVGRTTAADGCLRSDGNYPQQVASALGVADFRDVSCVGATTKAVTDTFKPAGAKKSVKAQLDAVTKDTQLVTIGIGIQDGGFLNSLFHLCVSTVCGSNVPAGTVKSQLATIGRELTDVIRDVTARAPGAYVVVVGYPELMPLDQDCATMPKMDDTQFFYTNQGWDQFTTSVGSAARQAGATYVDVRRLTANHGPCSDEPWVNGAKGIKGKALAYHPKAPEQKAVAEAVLATVRTR